MIRITTIKKGERRCVDMNTRRCDICGLNEDSNNNFDEGTYFNSLDLNVCFKCKLLLLESFASDISKNPNEYITQEWLRNSLYKIANNYWKPPIQKIGLFDRIKMVFR